MRKEENLKYLDITGKKAKRKKRKTNFILENTNGKNAKEKTNGRKESKQKNLRKKYEFKVDDAKLAKAMENILD